MGIAPLKPLPGVFNWGFVVFNRPSTCANAMLVAFLKVSARRLVWDSLDRNGDRAALLEGGGRFDLVIASDCLFFKARVW